MALLKNQAIIDGKWIDAKSKATFKVLNPASGDVVSTVPNMGVGEAQEAIDAAGRAFETWQDTTERERSQILKKWVELIEANKVELAKILSAENGKPFQQALHEVIGGIGDVDWVSKLTVMQNGEIVPTPLKDRMFLHTRQPIGVIGVITPWNFPFAMITRKVAAIVGAGCTCVIKPAEDTPLSALAAIQLAHEAGFPMGVMNVITSDRDNAAAVGKLLCESTKVAGISFTGSTKVGKILYAQSASTVKRMCLEMGGMASLIVFPTANIDKAVADAFLMKTLNCGQACISVNRFLLHEDIYDEFVKKYTELFKTKLIMGDGSAKDTTIGPLINPTQFERVSGLVEDAKQKGAKVILGGEAAKDIGKQFYKPTILANITKDMKIFNEEIFGPVCPMLKFKTEDEAVTIANNTRYGLASYLYSQDVSQMFRVSKALQFGMIGVNEVMVVAQEAAFAGTKESGIGVESSKHCFDDYTYLKTTCIGNL